MGVSRSVIAAVFVLDIIAFGLALGAESRRSHATIETRRDTSITYCRYSKDVSTGLGIGAFLFLFLGQTIVTSVTRCMCCSGPLTPGSSRGFAILFNVLSWFSFVIAEIFLLAGATRAAYRTRSVPQNGPAFDCATLRRGIFSAAAAFTFFTLLLSEAYYWCFCKAQEKNWQNYYGGGPYNPGAAAPYNPGAYHPGPGGPYNGGAYNHGSGPFNPQAVPPPGTQSIGMAAYPRS